MSSRIRGSFLVLSVLALLLGSCSNEQTAARCLDHYQTDFGNQTKYVPCPVEHPDAPWLEGNR